ncbi:hypothetical protein [Aquimarina litoralis]|uniref:hypothetical protein n=1 Tax=Aquimarina litoralis TaxID=584605 RepID=UPI001C561536|nr:hypothetical protein [Aquimarina litoralis]MBW1295153.1 hypothetical protein [Aquimarina litoralis]
MKKIILLLLVCSCFSFLQTEDSYKMTVTKIADAYNAKDADQIFGLFAADLQSSFTLDKVKTFITDNHAKKGMMGSSAFLMDDEGNKRYLMEFDNSSTILILGLSTDNKITKLELEEY